MKIEEAIRYFEAAAEINSPEAVGILHETLERGRTRHERSAGAD